jgi:hypothetical protein
MQMNETDVRELSVEELDGVAGASRLQELINALVRAAQALYESKYCNSKVCVELGEPEVS